MSTPKKKKSTPKTPPVSSLPVPVAPTPAQVKAKNAALPPPNKAKKRAVLKDAERAKKRLIERHGYKEDELNVMFKTGADLLHFYNNIARQTVASLTEDQIGWDSEDNFDAPPDEKQRLAEKRKAEQRKGYEEVNGLASGPVPVGAGAPAPGEDRPVEAPVSFAEFLQAGEDLKALLADEGDGKDGQPPEEKAKK